MNFMITKFQTFDLEQMVTVSGLSRGTVCVGHRASASPPARTDLLGGLPTVRTARHPLRKRLVQGKQPRARVALPQSRGEGAAASTNKATRTNRTDGKRSPNAMQLSVSTEPGSPQASPERQPSVAPFKAASQILLQTVTGSFTYWKFFQNVSYRMQRPTPPNSQPALQSRCPGVSCLLLRRPPASRRRHPQPWSPADPTGSGSYEGS